MPHGRSPRHPAPARIQCRIYGPEIHLERRVFSTAAFRLLPWISPFRPSWLCLLAAENTFCIPYLPALLSRTSLARSDFCWCATGTSLAVCSADLFRTRRKIRRIPNRPKSERAARPQQSARSSDERTVSRNQDRTTVVSHRAEDGDEAMFFFGLAIFLASARKMVRSAAVIFAKQGCKLRMYFASRELPFSLTVPEWPVGLLILGAPMPS